MRHLIIASLLLLPFKVFASLVTPAPDLVNHASLLTSFSLHWQTNVSLPSEDRPAGMGQPWGMLHLGTNADLFAMGTARPTPFNSSDFWVRYQLDPSSSSSWVNYACLPCGPESDYYTFSGEVWLAFKREGAGYQINMSTYLQLPTQTTGSWRLWPETFLTSQLPPGQKGVQTLSDVFALQTPEQNVTTWFNLSFLELNWNSGSGGYDLATSLTGFDNLFSYRYDNPISLNFARTDYRIAPVPLPAAAWLFGSGLGLLGLARRR